MTADEQLDLWVAGESVHGNDLGECCPDFSCCQPELKAPKKARIAFRNADESTRMKYLVGFLGAAISLASDKKVHIAGQGAPE